MHQLLFTWPLDRAAAPCIAPHFKCSEYQGRRTANLLHASLLFIVLISPEQSQSVLYAFQIRQIELKGLKVLSEVSIILRIAMPFWQTPCLRSIANFDITSLSSTDRWTILKCNTCASNLKIDVFSCGIIDWWYVHSLFPLQANGYILAWDIRYTSCPWWMTLLWL